jgi:hypothetical protein
MLTSGRDWGPQVRDTGRVGAVDGNDRSRLHPILVLQDVESVALVSGMVELVDPAVRIDIGLVFGR